MGDQFEKFILRHRERFDEDPDSDKVWNRIENKLEKREKKRDYSFLWKVAAVLLLISTVFLLIDRNQFRTESELDQYSEFKKAEVFYTTLIYEKKKEIEAYDEEGLKDQFINEINRLDQSYAELKKTFKKEASDRKLIDAMIENLQLRIDILNQQLSILKRLNKAKSKSDETTEI